MSVRKLSRKTLAVRFRDPDNWLRRVVATGGLFTAVLVTSGVMALFAQPAQPLVF